MAKEILAIPEDNLLEVINIIRVGLNNLPETSKEVREQLTKWCDEESEYMSD